MRIPSKLDCPVCYYFSFNHQCANGKYKKRHTCGSDIETGSRKRSGPVKYITGKISRLAIVNMAVLDEGKHQRKWFTCYGGSFVILSN